ncbi:MAG TPA: histidine kinase dimerization/phospho-acceptor domain-containing protein [Thermoanaerobaculia bacterium]|nr:histidine kinase dimerization/phospho-acceptor domain-containing protein [Thermoanaerobaculia bacterium]
MDASDQTHKDRSRSVALDDLTRALTPGVLVLDGQGTVRFGDERALKLLGCADRNGNDGLQRRWNEIRPRLEAAGLRWQGGKASRIPLEVDGAGPPAEPRRLLFDLRPGNGGAESVLLVSDLESAESLEVDLRLSAQMRALSQISPAVAHDLRAPINAMVFNLEILKETLAPGRVLDATMQGRQQRYVSVLKEELHRLHRSLEIFLAHTSPRGDRTEPMDLRELVEELASLLVAPARKQQVQVHSELLDDKVMLEGNRYLLRQALLHIALAVLAPVPRQGTLEVELDLDEEDDRRAVLRLAGSGPDEGESAEEAAPAVPIAGSEPGFGIRFSPGGTVAQLYIARAILASQGGDLRVSAGPLPAFEVEWVIPDTVSEKE